MWRGAFLFASFLVLADAQAQVPVIGPGATAFDPEIGVVNSGGVLDAQAVVSHDRRYVTITMGAQQAKVIEVRNFPVQAVTGGGGFVGGADPGAGNPAHTADPNRPGNLVLNPSPDELRDPLILNRRGMIRLAPVRN